MTPLAKALAEAAVSKTQAERPDYTGRVIGIGNDMVQAWITDRLGIVTRFVGHRDRAGGGYLLRSTGTEIPAHLQFDGEA